MRSSKDGESNRSISRCGVCGQPCEDKTITLALPNSTSGFAMIRNVPASVCLECGETHFSLRTAGRLMSVVRNQNPPEAVISVPLYDLNQAG